MTLSSRDELLLNTYVDGELDPIEATRFEQGTGIGLPQAMPYGSAGQLDRVSVPGLAIPPAVQHHQDHRCLRRRSV